jgi:hypothetical protein
MHCVRSILGFLEAKVNYHKAAWTMSKQDLTGWIDPAGRKTTPGPDHLRVAVSNYEEEIRERFKKFSAYTDGYTDRDKFVLDMKKSIRGLINVVLEYLKKTE